MQCGKSDKKRQKGKDVSCRKRRGEVRKINNYSIRIEVTDGEVGEILKSLADAQEKIYECYQRLQGIGVLTIVPNDKKSNLPLGGELLL